MRCNQITEQYPGSCPTQQGFVGEAEFHTEQQRKIDSHPCQVCVEAHQQVFPHQGRFPHHLVQRAQIKPSRKLESKGDEHIYPRPYPLRNKTPEHWHGERYRLCSSAHISILLYIPRSVLPVNGSLCPRHCLADGCGRGLSAPL